MPRAITLGQLKTRALRLSNLSGAQFDGASELSDLANTHVCEVLASLSEASPPQYQSKIFQITTTAGTWVYPIGTYVSDFGWLNNVFALEATDSTGVQIRYPVRSVQSKGRAAWGAPGGAVTVEIEYTPLPALLINEADTIDGLFGYDELVVALMARDMCIKQRQDYAGIDAKIAELRTRLMNEANNRDKGQPRRLGDVEDYAYSRYLPGAVGVRGYRLRGDNIELYQPSVIWW